MRKIYFVPEVFLDLEGELHLLGWADIHPLLLLTEEKSLYLFCAMYGVLGSIFFIILIYIVPEVFRERWCMGVYQPPDIKNSS